MKSCYFNKQGFISSLILTIVLIVYIVSQTIISNINDKNKNELETNNIDEVRFFSPYTFKVKV
ncbi:MAG: hypothetical protein ACO3UU_16775 [Minisyncoccia bacterium]